MSTPRNVCAFCRDPAQPGSREHVLPQWLSLLGYGPTFTRVDEHGTAISTSRQLNIVTRRICVACNTGWMARIDSGAANVMRPLIEATTDKVGELDRYVIARWFSKSILTVHLA